MLRGVLLFFIGGLAAKGRDKKTKNPNWVASTLILQHRFRITYRIVRITYIKGVVVPSPLRYSRVSQSLGCFFLHSSFPRLVTKNNHTSLHLAIHVAQERSKYEVNALIERRRGNMGMGNFLFKCPVKPKRIEAARMQSRTGRGSVCGRVDRRRPPSPPPLVRQDATTSLPSPHRVERTISFNFVAYNCFMGKRWTFSNPI